MLLRIVRGLTAMWSIAFLGLTIRDFIDDPSNNISFQAFQFMVLGLLSLIAALIANGQIKADRTDHRLEALIKQWQNNLEAAKEIDARPPIVRYEVGGPPLLPQREPLVPGRRFMISDGTGVRSEVYA